MAFSFSEIFHVGNDVITVDVHQGQYTGDIHRVVEVGDGGSSLEAVNYFNTLKGGRGKDTLSAQKSYATLDGGDGDDYIIIDADRAGENISNVVLTGGAGRDTFAIAPGDHTISATIKDFNPNEDTIVFVSVNGGLANLAAIDDGGIAVNENNEGLAEANARRTAQANINTASDGFTYDADGKVANLRLSGLGFSLNFEGVENETAFDSLSAIDINIADRDGASLGARPANAQSLLPNGLSIYHSDYYDEDWLYVSSDYAGDVWLGGVDYNGNAGLGWSDTTIIDIRSDNDTVGGRMLSGNDESNYIYAGSGGASLWGGTGGRDYIYGGAGADTFIAAISDHESTSNLRNVGENDIVYLGAIRSTDIFPAATVEGVQQELQRNIIQTVYLDGYSSLSGYNAQYNWRIWYYSSFLSINDANYGTYVYVNRDSNAQTSTLMLADGYLLQYNYLKTDWYTFDNDAWKPIALLDGRMTTYTSWDDQGVVAVGSAYRGSVWLDGYFGSMQIIDAVFQTVSGNHLVGNELDNIIYAGSGGASIWGGNGGNDFIYGGDGADTFFAGQGEGNTTVWGMSDDDIAFLWNVTADDVGGLSLITENGEQTGVNVATKDGNSIALLRMYDASSTTIMLADYSRWQYTYTGGGNWTQLVEPPPAGIIRNQDSITLTSDFAGNLYLGGVDWNGSTVASWHDDLIADIHASNDTVSGRVLAGNAQSIFIFAGSGGSSIWGGNGGSDYLYGGAGADTFIAGKGEGSANIRNVGDNDIVVLHNINVDDVESASFYESSSSNQIRLTTSDGTDIYIWYDTDTTSTTIRYANGDQRTFAHADGNWRDLFADTDTTMPAGLSKVGNAVYVASNYRGDVYAGGVDLDGETVGGWSDGSVESISAIGDTVGGRMLAGNEQSNEIRAGSGGASLWGGNGGERDNLYGGAGNDTFCISTLASGLTTWMKEIDENDIVYFQDVSSTDIFTANTDTRVYVEGISSGNRWQSAWHVWTYDNFLFFGDQSYNIDFFIKPTTGSKTTTLKFSDGYRLQFNFGDGNWYGYDDDTWKPYALISGNLSEYTTEGGVRGIAVYSGYEGVLRFDSSDYYNTIQDIDASNDTVSGRLLVANELNNSIRAGSGGASISGGGGDDTFVGGAGDDTFDVAEGDGTVAILDCADNDVVILDNNYIDDISYVGNGSNVSVTMSDGTLVKITGAEGSNGPLVLFADSSRRRYNYSTQSWEIVVPPPPDGLTRSGNNITVTSDYEGDIYAGGIDVDGNTVAGWWDSAIQNIDARNDTVVGRMLAGNANDNYIYAGAGGASIWGGAGDDGYDYLHGGDGVDTFVAATGLNESTTTIFNLGDEDIIYLYSVSSSNINSLNNSGSVYIQGITSGFYYNAAWRLQIYSTYISFTDNAIDNSLYINRKSDANLATFQFSDGKRIRYDYSASTWYGYEDEIWKPYALIYGSLSEYTTEGGARGISVSSAFEGSIYLNSLDYFSAIQDIDASSDTVRGRELIGNKLDNSIVAGSNGAVLNGGYGGADTLVGGAGDDTFNVDTFEDGSTTVLNCSDDDIVRSYYLTYDSLAGSSVVTDANGNAIGVDMKTTDGISLSIRRSDAASTTLVIFADYFRWQYSYADGGSWVQVSGALPEAIDREGNSITLTADYEGDLWLSDVDYNGSTVDGWHDNSVFDINATAVTVSGIMLGGNTLDNTIRAGDGVPAFGAAPAVLMNSTAGRAPTPSLRAKAKAIQPFGTAPMMMWLSFITSTSGTFQTRL